MNKNIAIHNCADSEIVTYPYKSLIFPGGEPHIQLETQYIKDQDIWVDARITNSEDFMTLVLLLDAIYPLCKSLSLFMPYFPGARQDRRQEGTAFSLKVYMDILYPKVDCLCVVDPHSKELGVHTPNCHPGRDLTLISFNSAEIAKDHLLNNRYHGIIAPDKGSEERAKQMADALGIDEIHYGSKKRDPVTGKLSGFEIGNMDRGYYLLVDDICDGGGTFVGLADEIYKINNGNSGIVLDLWVTHGIFSKGLDELKKRFCRIFATDSWPQKEDTALKVVDLKWHAAELFRSIFKY